MSESGSETPEFPDLTISDDSKDYFQLSKSLSKSQKRSYRKPTHANTGESIEKRKKDKSNSSRRGRSDNIREERKRRHGGEERYRDGRYERIRDGGREERSREVYDRERHSFGPKRRDERFHDLGRHSHSPKQFQQKYESYDRSTSGYKSHGDEKNVRIELRKRSKGANHTETQFKKGKTQSSGSESEGEIKPPVKKRIDDSKDPYVNSLIEDLESHSSNDSSDDSTHTPKELSGNGSLEGTSDSNKPGTSPVEHKAKTWRDIAEESSESETEQKVESEKEENDELIFSQMSENFVKYSEMQPVSSSEYEEVQKEDTQTSPKEQQTTKEEPMEQEPLDVPIKEKDNIEEEMVAELPSYLPALMGCRSVESYEWLNRIEEGTYGVVFRGKEKKTGDVVALKKLKMEKEREGFPITSLREINMLLKSSHPNIVHVREIVVGSNMDKIYIVMDYVEHDLKSLMEVMKQPFLEGEVKTLLIQLLRAVHHLHDNWILHRDLKTSNLLLSHKGILKVADFGLAREYGSPLKRYTPVVVTLWYRCPELILGAKEYSTAVDIWSVGCIFAELLQHKPMFMGKSEIDQLNQIFKELGTPNDDIWPGYSELPVAKKVDFAKQPLNNLRKRFPMITNSGFNLLNKFLTYDPKKRITAEEALTHSFFEESPLPVDPNMFPTWPAKSEIVKKQNRQRSPTAPEGGAFLLNQLKEKDDEEGKFRLKSAQAGKAAVGPGFTLKF